MNVSPLGSSNAKTYVKIEGITRKRPDVIFLSDVRAKDKGEDLKRLMGLTRNGCYKLYLNSRKESRGVCIAIKRNIAHEIYGTYCDNADNYMLLDVKLKGRRVTLGCIYGPNENDQDFYRELRVIIDRLGNKFILGGDFNTIINQSIGNENLDREGNGWVPNSQNSRIINEWLEEGWTVEPFRTMYPLQKET